MTNYTPGNVRQIAADYDFWIQWEHDKWKLISFTDRTSARFGFLNRNGEYTKWITVEAPAIRFMRGVEPDVLDQI
jgi:hypothetical protein